MITLLALSLIICTVFFVIYSIQMKERSDFKEWLSNFAVCYLLLGAICVFVGGFALAAITSAMPNKWEYGWENKIVAMQDNRAYIMSRHNVEASDRYYYMVDYGNGHYKQHWVNQNNSDIYETSSGRYVIKTYTKIINPSNWFMKDLERFRSLLSVDEHRWEFYVPKGSIVQDFTVDLK